MSLNAPGFRDGALGVVVTGGTRGIGYAIAKEYLTRGHSVVICSRTQPDLDVVVAHLKVVSSNDNIWGFACDVSVYDEVVALADYALTVLPNSTVDHLISNAAIFDGENTMGTVSFFGDVEAEQLAKVVQVNLIGSGIFVSRVFMDVFARRNAVKGGHLVLMFGAGSRGVGADHSNAFAYTSSKQGLSMFFDQLKKSADLWNAENAEEDGSGLIGVHAVNPGMVLTPSVIRVSMKTTISGFHFFMNIAGESPSSAALKILDSFERIGGNGCEKNYISKFWVLLRMATWWRFKGRFFGPENELTQTEEEMGIGPIGLRILEELREELEAEGESGD